MKRRGIRVSRSFSGTVCIFLFFACLLFPNAALGFSTAVISGRVTDFNNAVIPGARVDANNIDTNITSSTVTNSEGLFVIPNLPPGRYRIFVHKEGFQTVVKPDVVLHVQDVLSLSFSMQLGSIAQSVTIEGGAPLIQKESATVGTLVDRQFVENLPLNGRSIQTLISLTPGVVSTKANFNDQGQFSVNGQRANANYFMVDGVSANAGVSAGLSLVQSAGGTLPAFGASGGTNGLVSVDAIQEFKIQTSTFAPEFGRTPGAQIQIATRSGTNEFRGTAFEYFRNDALDARDWFANRLGRPKPALRQNDFGAVLGGPLIKNRTFFFISYEGLRLRLPQTALTLVPSLLMRQLAVSQIKPFLNAYPIPNGRDYPDGFSEFSSSYSDPLNLDATSFRIDHNYSDKLTFFGRYNYSPSKTIQRGISNSSLNNPSENHFKTQTLTVGSTMSFSPIISNEFRVNYTRTEGKGLLRLDDLGGASPTSSAGAIPPGVAEETSLLTFQLLGGRNLNIGKNVDNVQRQFNAVNNLSVTEGAHQLKFGFDYRLLLPINSPRSYDQIVTFTGLTGATGAITGNTLFISVAARDTVPLRYTNLSVYGQDTYKLTPRFTLTYGLRWDINPAPKGRDGKNLYTFENLDAPSSLRVAPEGAPLYKTTYGNFAPRIGGAFLLSPRLAREIVFRGGFGIFYDLGSGTLGSAAAGFPHARSMFVLGTPFPLPPAQAAPPPFTLTIPATGNAFVTDPNLKMPLVYQWNATIEESLGSNQKISVAYVGAIGRRLLRQRGVLPTTGFSVFITENKATSDYHALQLQYQRRLSKGLQALASYTWAHSIDIASSDATLGGTPLDPVIDRASSDFDVRHTFNAALTYDIPIPKASKWGEAILRNWSVDTLYTSRSATPVNLSARTDFVGGVQTAVRPNLVFGVPIYLDDPTVGGGRRFNRDAFIAPPAGQQGTLGRNVLRGFPVWQIDLSFRRQFNLSERYKLQFKAEFFNLLNHPNFGDPVNLLTDPFFGQSISMLGRSLGNGGVSGGYNPLFQIGGPRSIQFALRFSY